MVKAAAALTARAKARKAKAELDAQRAEQDRRVVDATTAFYEAGDALEVARAATVAAEEQLGAAISSLVELGQDDRQIATLCGLTAREVRDLKRCPAPKTAATTAPKTIPDPDSHESTPTGSAATAAA